MKRRDMMLASGAAVLGLSTRCVLGQGAEKGDRPKVLFFSRSAGFEHGPIVREGEELSLAEKKLTQWGKEHGFDVVCSKDGAIFDGNLDQFDLFVFYTSGDLTGKCAKPQPGKPMSPAGKQRLLDAVRDGTGFVGIHSATDTFRSEAIDPYIGMVGAEFTTHGPQQETTLRIVSPDFPGMDGFGKSLRIHDEWYAQAKFPKDIHVVMLQETEGMEGDMYRRPPYPATWARMHGKGRVFYTSMGHGKIWANPVFQQVLLGGIDWALFRAGTDVKPNIEQVAPGANQARAIAP